jgi:hypothetical protein
MQGHVAPAWYRHLAPAALCGMALAMHTHVTIRITSDEDLGGRTVRVDGWLQTSDVATLEEAVGADVRGIRLELADLRSADAAGIVALRSLEARGARLQGAPPFLRLLLGEGMNNDDPSGAGHD